MSKILFILGAMFASSLALAQTDVYYNGQTMVIPVKTDKLIEIILPETYVNVQPDVPNERVDDYVKLIKIDNSNRLFVKYLRSDYPISIHIWGDKTDNSYVIKADFLSESKVDGVYRVVSDVFSREFISKEAPGMSPDLNYQERAIQMGNDSVNHLNDSAYTIYRNQNKIVLSSIPNFMFILKTTYVSPDFVLYVMDVINRLPVAQPLNLKNIYIPGAIVASPSLVYLSPAPRNEKELLNQDYKTTVRIVFDKKNKEFAGELFNE